jgi:hypothetical protein
MRIPPKSLGICRREVGITPLAALHGVQPGNDRTWCNRVANWMSLKTGCEVADRVTQFGEPAGFWGVERGGHTTLGEMRLRVRQAVLSRVASLELLINGKPHGQALSPVMDHQVSRAHCDQPRTGCALAALESEVAR